SPAMGSAHRTVEDELEKILSGEGSPVQRFDSAPDLQSVALRKTTCYIVCGVIFNEKNEVLMMQEAKPECHGQWYLPAGRMEENESIVEGMRREVREETGLECDPVTLLLVQENGPRWIRFTFLARATGGMIKTEAEADSESLQARWWDRLSHLPLRARDILPLIEAGLRYKEEQWFPPTLPVDIPCHLLCQRLILTFTDTSNHLWLLLGTQDDLHLPVTVSGIGPAERSRNLTWAIRRLVRECMPCSQITSKTLGVFGLQHHGRDPGKTDGICFNVLVSIEHTSETASTGNPPVLESDKFQWHKVENQDLKAQLEQRQDSRSVVPIHSIF
uniref:Nudix (nucleoside diphosphate linked moiety X)-type motif 18 n=1 Tax=Lepisosteus oculatus TaxID=7918 RepID=W5NE77_LEPOC